MNESKMFHATENYLSSQNVLNQTIYNPSSQLPLNQKFWWEAFGMFFLILLICNVSPSYNFDYCLSALLPVAIMLSVKQSGAHYNPSMSFSNFFIRFSPVKFDPYFMWTYFKAQFFPAFIAFNMGFYLKGYYAPIDLPNSRQHAISIILSELVGTFMLVFLLQKICNSQTTFTTSDIETYSFVVVFVFVARRFAVCSGNNINPVANLASVAAAIFQCNFRASSAFWLYLLGDFLGSCLGTLFYNYVYWPAYVTSRRQKRNQQAQIHVKKNYENQDDHQEALTQLIKKITQQSTKDKKEHLQANYATKNKKDEQKPRDITQIQKKVVIDDQKDQIDINKITKIEHVEDLDSDEQIHKQIDELKLLSPLRKRMNTGQDQIFSQNIRLSNEQVLIGSSNMQRDQEKQKSNKQ